MHTDITRELLRISYLPGMGTVAIRRLIKDYRKLGDKAFNQLATSSFERADHRSSKDPAGWRKVLEDCTSLNVEVISAVDAEYPGKLKQIKDFPPFLFVKGSIEALGSKGAAVVGTREASRLGLSWARQIAGYLVSKDFVVISGLAFGIDTAAHEGAIRAGGRTIAILAHGLHQVSPAKNKGLAEEILATGGALVSEHPPGVPPRRAEFVRRNRIQSGMSSFSIVVESGETGGAIHQANFTREQGRPLFCVCPREGTEGAVDFNYGGARRLEAEFGAQPLRSRSDLENFVTSDALDRNSVVDRNEDRLL